MKPISWKIFRPSMNQQFAAMTVLFLSLFQPLLAHAVPAFARQTGQNCVACHAGGQFPELTPYGRLFKLTGYTIGSRTIPVSVSGVASLVKSQTPNSGNTQLAKDGALLFQTGSVFVAGKITDNVGIFSQYTYNNYGGDSGTQGTWGSDNFDVRYADRIITPNNDFIFGVTLNNNPTVSDPWNTAPAWILYVPTAFGVTGPESSPQAMGQQVAGMTAYMMWNQFLYAEAGTYRTASGVFSFLSQGTPFSDQTKLTGNSPYGRLALTHEWGAQNAMVGVFALNLNEYPGGVTDLTGPTTQYRDRGVDAQYQYLLDPHTVTGQFSYIRETIDDQTGSNSNPIDYLNQLRVKGSYIYHAKYGGSLTYFKTTGTPDFNLYSGDSATNSPDTAGWIPEVFWMPIQNIRVGLQYYTYQQFNGSGTNYDGAGRNAKDNNTAFLYAWGAF